MKQRFDVDPAHTTLGFSAKHMMVTTVRGQFREFTGYVEIENDDPTTAVADFTIKAESLITGQDRRDDHLRSGDFFETEKHPEITFHSTSVTPVGGDRYKAAGDLTIRGVSLPIELDVTLDGRVNDPWGNDRIGLTASGQINRKDWGLNWNQVLEAGRMLVGETVKIEVEAAMVRKLEQVPAGTSAA